MIAGLPACGIGGMFYLLSTLFMPLYELNKLLRKKRRQGRWKLISFELMIAFSMIGGFWLTGEILGRLISLQAIVFHSPGTPVGPARNVVHIKPFLFSSALLFFVLAFVYFQGIILAKRPRK